MLGEIGIASIGGTCVVGGKMRVLAAWTMLAEQHPPLTRTRWLPWLVGRSDKLRDRGEASIDDVPGRDVPVRGVEGTELP